MMHKLDPQFTFAGFTWPKFVWSMPRGSLAKRLERSRKPECMGPYYHSPEPILRGPNPGTGFYLDGDGMPGLRWQWAHNVNDARVHHTGWFTSEDGYGEKIAGIVMRLPHGRGFLAGWSMGKNMASEVDGTIYDDEIDAARAADREAELAAERQREYEEEEKLT